MKDFISRILFLQSKSNFITTVSLDRCKIFTLSSNILYVFEVIKLIKCSEIRKTAAIRQDKSDKPSIGNTLRFTEIEYFAGSPCSGAYPADQAMHTTGNPE